LGIGTTGQLLTVAGGVPTWAAPPQTGVTITDDTSTNATRYITFTDATTGTETGLNVSSTKLQFNPSTGTLSTTVLAAPTIQATGTASSEGRLELYEDTDNGSNYVAIKAPSLIASNVTWTLPNADGTNGQVLSTNGSGVLSWATGSGSGDVVGPASATDNAVARFDGTTGKLIQNSAVTIADTSGDITTNGVVLTANGTVSAPSYSASGDTNTGVYFPAADTVGFAAGGVEVANLVSGTLSIPANSSAASKIRLYEDTDNGTNYVDLIAPASVASDRTITFPDNTGTVITTASTFAGTGPAFAAKLTANQTISHNTTTKIQFNSEVFDTNGDYDPTTNYRFTPTTAGYYSILCQINWNVTDGRQYYYQPSIYKNGASEITTQDGYLANAGGRKTQTVSGLIYLNGSSDYIEFYVYNFDYTAATTVAIRTDSFASAFLARAA
jgi:hypothetical protein